MKKTISLILCMMIFVSLLAGCSCKHNWLEANCLTAKTCSICQEVEGEPLGHTWVDADCVTAKTCSVCLETEGDPLGHAPGEWKESIEMITCTGTKEQYCSVCSELIASEAVTASTLVQDDLFLFTPREFMDRLTRIAEQHSDNFTYEFIFSSVGLQVLADIDGNQNIIQFFHSDTTALTSSEIDTAQVWCVSLIAVGQSNADFRNYFYMASDPLLDKDHAFLLDSIILAAFLDAASRGEAMGYYLQNGLLYEHAYFPEPTLGQDYSLHMFNVYASDYR